MSPDQALQSEIHRRLLSRPAWHPARYPGECLTCGGKVEMHEPVMLMRTDRGPRWTCSCVFMPGSSLDRKVGALRQQDGWSS